MKVADNNGADTLSVKHPEEVAAENRNAKPTPTSDSQSTTHRIVDSSEVEQRVKDSKGNPSIKTKEDNRSK